MKLVHSRGNVGKEIKQKLLAPASFVYTAGAFCRLLAYKVGAIPRHKSPVTVLSVGNLTVGGTGKTPIVIDLANRALLAGFKPAILSRGYKRKSGQANLVVSDGKRIMTTCELAGDEPFLIASKTHGAVVIVGADRMKSSKIAVDRYGCDLLILDDGFQHVKIMRDIDIVLIDYNDDIDTDKVVPAGRLREPLAALNRASSVVISKVPAKPDRQRLENISKVVRDHCPHANIGLARFQHRGFFKYEVQALDAERTSKDVREGHESNAAATSDQTSRPRSADTEPQNVALAPSALSQSDLLPPPIDVHEVLENGTRIGTIDLRFIRLFAFSGIARPELFYDQLKEQGLDIAQKHSFGDHHWYSVNDMQKLVAAATKCRAKGLICTEKDLVKIIPYLDRCPLPVYAPGLETEWINRLPQAVEELFLSSRNKDAVKAGKVD